MAQADEHVFILGVERGGSTWLSNILDASPDVVFYMEPFVHMARFFREFPSRLLYLGDGAPLLEEALRERMPELYRYKYPLWDRHDAPPLARFAVQALLSLLREGGRLAGVDAPLTVTRHHLLSLNQQHDRPLRYQQKAHDLKATVVKELRLNFHVPLLRRAFPGARFLVALRNPLAQLDSMHRQFAKGRLVQLREVLWAFPEALAGQQRFAKYAEALAAIDASSMLHRAAAYWFVNYGTLIEELEATGAAYRIVRNEALSERPEEESQAVYSFLGLPYPDEVAAYVRRSSQGGGEVASVMDTTRDSRAYYRRVTREAAPAVREAFEACAAVFWPLVPDAVREYETFLDDLLTDR